MFKAHPPAAPLLFRASNPVQSRPASSFHLTWNNRTAHIDEKPSPSLLSIVSRQLRYKTVAYYTKGWNTVSMTVSSWRLLTTIWFRCRQRITHFKRDTLAWVFVEEGPEKRGVTITRRFNKTVAKTDNAKCDSVEKSCIETNLIKELCYNFSILDPSSLAEKWNKKRLNQLKLNYHLLPNI